MYGAVLNVKEGDKVNPGSVLAGWDPFNTPIITEVSGTIKFGDMWTGRTMKEKLDPITGKSSKMVVEFKDVDVRPRVSIKDDSGKTAKLPSGMGVARYPLPVGAFISVSEGDPVSAGDVIAKIPRETTKTKDITGGLPRVAELFEVRKPKEHAIISEIDGEVTFGKHTKGKRKVVVTPEVGRRQGIPDSQGQAHQRARRRLYKSRRAVDGRFSQSARHSQHPGDQGIG